MDTPREKFVLEVKNFVDEFFVEFGHPKELVERTKNMVDYVIPDERITFAPFLTREISKMIKPNLTEEELHMADSAAWIYQMYEAFLCIHDDYLDDGAMRYGKITWAKLHNDSKSVIVHDAALFKAIACYTLKRMFSHSPTIYQQLLDFFCHSDDTLLKASILDGHHFVQNFRDGNIALESFNLENYNLIMRMKAISFFLVPIAMAMIVTGFRTGINGELYENIKTICGDLAIHLMVFDDYFDCYHPKAGQASTDSDIRRGQFTWCFLMAKERCTDDNQVRELLNNYGRDNDESVTFIKTMYENIGIHDLLKKYSNEDYEKMMKKVDVFFSEEKVVHKIMTYYIPYAVKFLKDGGAGMLE